MSEGHYLRLPRGCLATVVSYLEMREPPPPRPVPGEPLPLERWHPDTEGYRRLYRAIGEEWLWFSRLEMPDAELDAIISDPRVELWRVAGTDDQPDGRGILELDRRVDGQVEFAFFGVTADLIGTSAARQLMNHALARAWTSEGEGAAIGRVWVHTCTFDHPAALAFYRRSGFRLFRQAIEILRDPRVTGVLSRGAARHVPMILSPA